MNRVKDKFYNLTIRKKLLLLLCVAGFVPVVLLGASISMNMYETVLQNRQVDMANSLELACVSVNNQMYLCEQMMRYFVYDQSVIEFLECSPEKKTERYGYYQNLREAISALQYQNLTMQSVTIYSQGILQSFGDETQPLALLKEEPWYEEGQKDGQWLIDQENWEMIVLYKIPGYSGLESYAVVRVNINTMFQSLSHLATGSCGVAVYDEGEIWSAYGEQCVDSDGEPLSFSYDNDSYIWAQKKLDRLGITVVCFQKKNSIQVLSGKKLFEMFLLIGICLAAILLLGRKSADYISRPLELLTEEIQKVDENKLGTEINSDRKDELGILIRSYNHMMKRIRDLIINPHFLYNSLSIINWKAIEAGQEEISSITIALSNFYRTALNKGDSMISIRMALENVQAYLKLQSWMGGGRRIPRCSPPSARMRTRCGSRF